MIAGERHLPGCGCSPAGHRVSPFIQWLEELPFQWAARFGNQSLALVPGSGGQLGNQLMLLVHLLAFSRETGSKLVQLGAPDMAGTAADHFLSDPQWIRISRKSTLPYLPQGRPGLEKRIRRAKRNRPAALRVIEGVQDDHLLDRLAAEGVTPGSLLEFTGWPFRGVDLVKKHSGWIRKNIGFGTGLDSVARRIRTIRESSPGPVWGLHIRHGDYANWRGGQHYYEVEAYAAMITRLAEKSPGVSLVIVSDDRISMAAFAPLAAHCFQGNAVEDMGALSLCDGIIGPVSTFARIAAFLGDKPYLRWKGPEHDPILSDFVRLESP